MIADTSLMAQEFAWKDRSLSADARARLLVKELTLDEKIGLVHGSFPPKNKALPSDAIMGAGYVPGVPRLGVPSIRETDASLGVANVLDMRKGDVATALPSGLALGASFDPALMEAGGAMIGKEARAKGFNVMLAGGANLTRDPWAGRNFEYLGEDVLHTGVMAGASIRGIQSNGIVSTIKHFAFNSQETGRNVMNAQLNEAELRESDLLAFQIAIERGGPGSVMCAYNRVNQDYACESDFLINQVLKRDWGYDGWVMSDWGAVHSTVKAALAGLDQQSGYELDQEPYFASPLKMAVQSGDIPLQRVDDMVTRITRAMIKSGAYDDDPKPRTIDYASHAAIAQTAAEKGIVLLKNDNGLLPIAATARSILVIGGHADVGVLSGGGSSQVRPVAGIALEADAAWGPAASFGKKIYHASSPLEAIRKRAPSAQVRFLDGLDIAAAAEAAAKADLVVVFAEQWRTEAEDVEHLGLDQDQDALINAISKVNPATIVVLETGGAALMPWIDQTPAVLAAWYPGERGGEAIARVLFGEVNPSGRLPISFPKGAEQAPRPSIPGLAGVKAAEAAARGKRGYGLAWGPRFDVAYPEGADVGYRWLERQGQEALFPFGHGLSYTRFEYADVRIDAADEIKVSFTVTNVGDVAGEDTPQIYAAVAARGRPPIRRLVGWSKVALAPQETKPVTIILEPRLLAQFDTEQNAWIIPDGETTVTLSRSAVEATGDIGSVVKLRKRHLRP